MNSIALKVRGSGPKAEETIQYWLGQRDAYTALLLTLKKETLEHA